MSDRIAWSATSSPLSLIACTAISSADTGPVASRSASRHRLLISPAAKNVARGRRGIEHPQGGHDVPEVRPLLGNAPFEHRDLTAYLGGLGGQGVDDD
jgi:hypothetical protein